MNSIRQVQGVEPATSTLKPGSLGFLETIGQSLANISPTMTPSINVVALVALAGMGGWLVYGMSTIALLFVGMNIAVLASRFAAAGSFFVFISRSLGPVAGGVAGWGLVAAYTGTAMGVLAGEVIFIQNALSPLGMTVPDWVVYVVSMVLVWYLASHDVKLSSRVSLLLESASIVIVGGVLFFAFRQHPERLVDHAQLSLHGTTPKGMAEAMVMGIFSFVGFESAASLGKESRDPLRMIPRAVIWSMVLAGLFCMFVAYSMTVAYNGDVGKLGGDTAPLKTLLTGFGVPALSSVFYVIAMLSAFSCALASVTAASRLLFSMGRYQFVHRSMGMVHTKHQTPHYAVAVASLLTLAVVFALLKAGAVNTFGYTSTFATYGFVLAYFLISVSAPLYLKRQGQLKTANLVIGVLGAVSMVGVLVGSVYPVPDYPYNVLPYLFLVYIAFGLGWLLMLKRRAPQVLDRIEHDLEASESEIFGRK
ncbi:amino acid permease [Burkholderia cepacia]|uniref:APC family permease n=1 Tax=Burkholderia cepacia TaxID=292 RepID=UPI0007605AE6|nr:APC family permease [Burkholderia cepacia]KVZ18404.1 amino acid permease [Burkholderia cepacia]